MNLFDIPETLSPKEQWLRRHRASTFQNNPECVGHECPETGDMIMAWSCIGPSGSREGGGDTEFDATIDYANRNGLTHWTVEEWERDKAAMRSRCP